jgi:hypothetical protein
MRYSYQSSAPINRKINLKSWVNITEASSMNEEMGNGNAANGSSTRFSELEMWILEYLTSRGKCGANHVTIRTVVHSAPKHLTAGMDEKRIDAVIQGLYGRGLLRPGGTEISNEFYHPLETFLLSDKGFKVYGESKR